MMKVFVLLALVAAGSLTVAAQTPGDVRSFAPCNLTVQNSPTIQGLHLGMTTAEMFKQFPGSSTGLQAVLTSTDDHFGKSGVEIPQKYIPESMSSVKYVYVELFDDHVAGFRIRYDGPRWRSVDEFIAKLTESFGLPAAGDWRGSGDNSKTLVCGGVRIIATGSRDETWIWIQDLSAMQTDEKRRAEAEEKARKDFRP